MTDYETAESGDHYSEPPRKSGWRTWLLAGLVAFAAGGVVTHYASEAGGLGALISSGISLRSDGGLDEELQHQPEPAPSASQASAVAAQSQRAVAVVERAVEQQGGLEQRLVRMEARLNRLDRQSQEAAGNATRAESLLIAFATRRALERGAPLGYLSQQLQWRFGETRPDAVRTVIAAAQDPVTVDELLAGLDALAPELSAAPADEGFFARIGRELSSAVVVRHEDTPSPAAERRIERARLFLQSGRVSDALIEVRNLPNAAAARAWTADARRFADAQAALELIETQAIGEGEVGNPGA